VPILLELLIGVEVDPEMLEIQTEDIQSRYSRGEVLVFLQIVRGRRREQAVVDRRRDGGLEFLERGVDPLFKLRKVLERGSVHARVFRTGRSEIACKVEADIVQHFLVRFRKCLDIRVKQTRTWREIGAVERDTAIDCLRWLKLASKVVDDNGDIGLASGALDTAALLSEVSQERRAYRAGDVVMPNDLADSEYGNLDAVQGTAVRGRAGFGGICSRRRSMGVGRGWTIRRFWRLPSRFGKERR
jgi:hypothetical protein